MSALSDPPLPPFRFALLARVSQLDAVDIQEDTSQMQTAFPPGGQAGPYRGTGSDLSNPGSAGWCGGGEMIDTAATPNYCSPQVVYTNWN